MSGKNPINDDDRALFRDAIGEVKPVAYDRKQPNTARPQPNVRSSERDDASVMDELLADFSESDLLETGEHLSFTRPGIQRSVLRKLKTGRYAIQAELDLHGHTADSARVVISEFLQDALQRGLTCVRIIHGRGRKKAEKAPVLKPLVATRLARHKQVLAFCSARENDGGTGAVYVLLQRRR